MTWCRGNAIAVAVMLQFPCDRLHNAGKITEPVFLEGFDDSYLVLPHTQQMQAGFQGYSCRFNSAIVYELALWGHSWYLTSNKYESWLFGLQLRFNATIVNELAPIGAQLLPHDHMQRI